MFQESLRFVHALTNNRLVFLSLLGVTIGILALSVFTVVDSLEIMCASIEQISTDVIYIQKWPWGADDSGV